MATVAEVRALLGDTARHGSYVGTGDGSTKRFVIAQAPIVAASEVIKVNAATQVDPTNYSLDDDMGVLTFVSAPGNGLPIDATFQTTELSDAALTTLIAIEGTAYRAAAAAARALAARYASMVDKQVGDLRISFSQRARAWLELATILVAAASRSTASIFAPSAGGQSRSGKQAIESDSDRVVPAFTRDLHESPGSEDEVAR